MLQMLNFWSWHCDWGFLVEVFQVQNGSVNEVQFRNEISYGLPSIDPLTEPRQKQTAFGGEGDPTTNRTRVRTAKMRFKTKTQL